MYALKFYPYYSLDAEDYGTYDTREEVRKEVASVLRDRRAYGLPCTTVEPGQRWEVLEPEDNMSLIPDDCGVLALRHITFECRQCGQHWEDKEARDYCCSEQEHWDMMTPEERELEEEYAS